MITGCLFCLVCNKFTGLILVALLGLKLYLWSIKGVCKSKKRLDGKTAIVTGANSGIGLETARDLARRGARVILGCRNKQRADKAKDDIIASTGNKQVIVHLIDMASLASVRKFAEDFLATEERLDILVNNAGVSGLRPKKSEDGLDVCMQVNHYGPFLLTHLLLDILKKSAPSRIVMVSSIMHTRSELNIDNLHRDRPKSPQMVYNNSKLCNVLVANEISRRLADAGVTANSLHPGAVWTDVFSKLPKWQLCLLGVVARLYFKDKVEGAQTSIYLAVAEELEGVSGKYFEDCREKLPLGIANNRLMSSKLWELSEEAVGLKPGK